MACRLTELNLDITAINQTLSGLDYELKLSEVGLQLIKLDNSFTPLQIDFIAGKNRHRRLYGGGINQPLSKAVGIKLLGKPSVLDVTAGLGRDAFVIATLGCQVTMVERNPVIASLLCSALEQAETDEDAKVIIQRINLQAINSLHYLENLMTENLPEVIYMDPMYPHRQKSALVKKEMRIFRDVVGNDEDSAELLELACQKATRRVAVKRPKGAEFLAEKKPDVQIQSPNTRYDVYLTR